MMKKLEVIKPFYAFEVGEILTLDENTNQYVATTQSTNLANSDAGEDVAASFSATISISVDYAKLLIERGFLAEHTEKEAKFVNIFDQIDILIKQYEEELNDLNSVGSDVPKCLIVEKETTLTNLLTLLNYLKSLKK